MHRWNPAWYKVLMELVYCPHNDGDEEDTEERAQEMSAPYLVRYPEAAGPGKTCKGDRVKYLV